jgi:(2Fe-2S) ferredoxin
MNKPKHHIFVCSSSRLTGEIKGFCAQNEGLGILEAIVEEIQDQDLDSEIMVTNTGCLGLCSMGPVVLVYPDNFWYGKVSVEDVPEIIEALCENKAVERLLL